MVRSNILTYWTVSTVKHKRHIKILIFVWHILKVIFELKP